VPELRPGDVFVSPIGPARREIVNPDAATDGPLVAVPIAHAEAADNNGTSGAWNWLLWLGGTGVALILGLLLFGRVLRERFGSFGFRKVEIPPRRRDDDPTQETRVVREIDFEFEDMINAQAISLDADLDAGTGLDPSTEIDVAQDFGFSASGQVDTEQLDLEITAEAAREPEEAPTDVIAPNHRQEMETILESEDPPSDDETEEYDMSMIVDATKQPLGDYDATAKDLHAVMVEVTGTDDDYTMDGTVDYRDLEQDYEEEFTATQAANAEIEKAALELARRMDEDDTFNVTAEMSTIGATEEILAPDRTIEQSTAEMPTVSDPDMTAELTSNLPTSIEAENDALADDGPSDVTVEMTAAGSDITIDTRLDTARIDTKGKRK
jgi:hypothetical protein